MTLSRWIMIVGTVGLLFGSVTSSYAYPRCSTICKPCTLPCSTGCDAGTPGNPWPTTCGNVNMCKQKPANCGGALSATLLERLSHALVANDPVRAVCKVGDGDPLSVADDCESSDSSLDRDGYSKTVDSSSGEMPSLASRSW